MNIVSPRSLSSCEIQRSSFAQIDNTIYSALVVKVVTVEIYGIAAESRWIQKGSIWKRQGLGALV